MYLLTDRFCCAACCPCYLVFLSISFCESQIFYYINGLRNFGNCPTFTIGYPINTAGRFLLYYLPDLLWVISFSSFLMFVLPYRKSQTTTLGIIFTVALTEAIQVVLPNRFTFDWVDLIISVLTAFIIIKVSKYDAKNRD